MRADCQILKQQQELVFFQPRVFLFFNSCLPELPYPRNPENVRPHSSNSTNKNVTQNLGEARKFTYLGRVVTTQGGGGDDIACRIGKARTAFRKLNRTWKSSNYSIMTKVHFYNSLVKSVLLYGCETWKMNEGDARKLDTF